jgi:hypothetical protein
METFKSIQIKYKTWDGSKWIFLLDSNYIFHHIPTIDETAQTDNAHTESFVKYIAYNGEFWKASASNESSDGGLDIRHPRFHHYRAESEYNVHHDDVVIKYLDWDGITQYQAEISFEVQGGYFLFKIFQTN